jgi:hypothetical protein
MLIHMVSSLHYIGIRNVLKMQSFSERECGEGGGSYDICSCGMADVYGLQGSNLTRTIQLV